jgi:SNF2 family DNA or RNA helicase
MVITTYGISRIDIDLLQSYFFDYMILDESQNIKKPFIQIIPGGTAVKIAV